MLSTSAQAEFFVGPGATGSSFLKIPIAARATGLAGAFTAVSGDVTALEYNPAGIAHLQWRAVNLSFIRYIEDATLQSVGVGFPIRPTFMNTQEVERDKLFIGIQYRLFRVDDEFRNEVGVRLREFDIKDQLIQLAGAYSPSTAISFGLSGKVISSEIDNESVSNFAVDLGSLWIPHPHWSLGASVLNVGPSKSFIDEEDPLPLTARVGASTQRGPVLLLGDLSMGRDKIIQPATAAEWSVARHVQIRAGFLFHTTPEFTGGLGFDFSPTHPRTVILGLDYAVQTRNEFGATHTVSFKILY